MQAGLPGPRDEPSWATPIADEQRAPLHLPGGCAEGEGQRGACTGLKDGPGGPRCPSNGEQARRQPHDGRRGPVSQARRRREEGCGCVAGIHGTPHSKARSEYSQRDGRRPPTRAEANVYAKVAGHLVEWERVCGSRKAFWRRVSGCCGPRVGSPAPLKASAPRGAGQGFSDQLLLRGEGSVSDSRLHGRGPGAPLGPGSPQSHRGGQRAEGTRRGCRLSSGGDLGRQTPCGGRCGETEDAAVAAGGPDQRWPRRSHTLPAQAGGRVLAPHPTRDYGPMRGSTQSAP